MIQQKKKKETQKKSGSSIASMMAKRDRSKIENRTAESYMELLKKPRSDQYVEAVKRMVAACNELADIEEELAKVEKELSLEGSNRFVEEKELLLKMAAEGEGAYATELPKDEKEVEPPHGKREDEKPAIPSWLVEEEKPAAPSWLSEENTVATSAIKTEAAKATVSWLAEAPTFKEELARIKEKQQQAAELKAKREAIAEELREAKRQFEASLPAPERMIGIIYPEMKRDILLKYGVIAVPGTQFDSPEQLLAQVQPQTEQEKQQWLKGNDIYCDYWCEELLLVEIYRDAICVVYDNGDVRTA